MVQKPEANTGKNVPGPGDPAFEELREKAKNYLDEEVVESISSIGDMLHYLGSKYGDKENKPEGWKDLFDRAEKLDPFLSGRKKLRGRLKAESDKKEEIRSEIFKIMAWRIRNAYRSGDDPEIIAKEKRQEELTVLLNKKL